MHRTRALWALSLLISLVLQAGYLRAADSENEEASDSQFSLMKKLSEKGLHDVHNENWNFYGQYTYIDIHKPAFHTLYTNLNGSNSSLLPGTERSFTETLTLFFGVRLWQTEGQDAEFYVVPEAVAEQTLSKLKGIGGAIENFELQKTGGPGPTFYRSRLFLRQTFELGGKSVDVESDQMQLAKKADSHRLVFTIGNYSFIDVFDKNNVIGDLRRSFMDESFMTYSAWDYPSDIRGYSVGIAAEFYWDNWTLRLARMVPPQKPDSDDVDFRFFQHYGDALEIEHNHEWRGQAGAIRALFYRNQQFMGGFAGAINALNADPNKNAANCGNLYNFGSTNSSAPDLCWDRGTRVKVGAGLSLEQNLSSVVGVFARGMYSDGKTEVASYNSADRSVNLGTIVKGKWWRRPADTLGVGFSMSWISDIHAEYLEKGGVDAFIGDGRLRRAAEGLGEIFYSWKLLSSTWLSADYQYLSNPGYNADRGPVSLYGGRVHAEF
jgi:hypothetical protein